MQDDQSVSCILLIRWLHIMLLCLFEKTVPLSGIRKEINFLPRFLSLYITLCYNPTENSSLRTVILIWMAIHREKQYSWWPPPLMLPLLLWCRCSLFNDAAPPLMFSLHLDVAIPPLPPLQCCWFFFDVDELWWVDRFWFFPLLPSPNLRLQQLLSCLWCLWNVFDLGNNIAVYFAEGKHENIYLRLLVALYKILIFPTIPMSDFFSFYLSKVQIHRLFLLENVFKKTKTLI